MRVKNLLLVAALMAGFSLIPAGRVTAQTFKNLYSFTTVVPNSSYTIYSNSDGADPQAGLLLSGDTLLGTTSQGGSGGNGTVFAVRNDGLYFTNLHSFTA